MTSSVPQPSARFPGHRSGVAILALGLLGLGVLSAQDAPDPAADLLANARKAYEGKDYTAAVMSFRDFLAKFASHKDVPAARYGLALSLLDAPVKDHKAALEQLQLLAGKTDFAERPGVLFHLGVAERGLQRFDEAGKQFAAAAQAFSARVKEVPKDAEELPIDLEWAAVARCNQAEMQLRAQKIKDAQTTVSGFLKDPVLLRSRYRGLGLYYHGVACFLLKDNLSAGRSLSFLAPFADPVFGSHGRYLLARVHHLENECAEATVHYEGLLADREAQKKAAAELLQQPEKLANDPAEKARLEALVNGPPPEHVARASFYLGLLNYQAGKFADAEGRFADFANSQPSSPLRPEAQLFQGMCRVQQQQFSEAIQVLQPLAEREMSLAGLALFWLGKAQAGTADPEDTDAFQAILARARGSLRRSADKFQPLPSTDPETARLTRVRRGEALLELAEVHLRANQTRDAAGIFNQVALERLLPGQEEEVLQRQLTAHNLAGEYAESDKLCAQFQTSYPRSPLLPEALFRHAENAFFQGLAAQKKSGKLTRETSQLNEEAGKYYALVADKFAEFPHVSYARYGLALTHYARGELEKAKEVLETVSAPERTGELVIAPYIMADCLIRLAPGKADDALAAGRLQEQLNGATELLSAFAGEQVEHPLATEALLRLGLCQRRLAALQAKPEDRTALLNAAKATYERILVEYPLNEHGPEAAFERAKCLVLIGGDGALDTAMARLRSFAVDPLKKSPVAPLALLQLATLLRSQDNKAGDAARVLAQCRRQHESALLKDPARASWAILLQYHHATALKEAGQFAEARSLFERIGKQAGSGPLSAEAALRWGQALIDEGWQKIEKANQVLGMQNLPQADAEAAKKSQAEGWQALKDAVGYFEKQAEQLKQKQPQSEVRARLLYEAAWGHRAFADQEVEAARSKIQEELHRKLQEEAAKNTPEGQEPPQVPVPEVPLSKIPLQPSEQKSRASYQALMSSISDHPLAIHARLELAELHLQRDDLAAAMILLNQALELEPAAELADLVRLRLGMCLLTRGNAKAALPHFESLARNPDNPLATQGHYRAAECLLQSGDLNGAIQRLAIFRDQEKFQNVGNISDLAQLRMGHALARLKKWDESRRAYANLIERFGGSGWVQEAQYGIGWTLQQQKQFGPAVENYAQAVGEATNETAARALLQIGICQLEQNQQAEALATLQSVPGKGNHAEISALALIEAAHLSQKQTQKEAADKLLRQVIKDYAGTSWASVAKQWVSAAKLGTPPHQMPAAVNLLALDISPTWLDPVGQHQDDRVSLDDPTEAVMQAALLARVPPERQAPAPWLRLGTPDPFELSQQVRLRSVPEDRLPPLDLQRVPRP